VGAVKTMRGLIHGGYHVEFSKEILSLDPKTIVIESRDSKPQRLLLGTVCFRRIHLVENQDEALCFFSEEGARSVLNRNSLIRSIYRYCHIRRISKRSITKASRQKGQNHV